MGRFWAFLLVVLAAVGVMWYRASVYPSPATGLKPQLAVVTGGSGPYWQLIANGAKAAATDLAVDLTLKMPEQEESRDLQVQLLSALDLDQLDGVALSPLDAANDSAIINRIAEKAFVITFDSDAPQSGRHSYVGTSNIAAGRSCAARVKKAIPDGGRIAVVMANLSKQNMIDRKAGFEQEITKPTGSDGAESKYEVVDYFTDEGDAQRSSGLVGEVLSAHPDLACIVGMNAYHGPLLVKAVGDAQRSDKLSIVAFDEDSETLAGVESGAIFATIAQDPYQYGYQSIRTLVELCHGSQAQRPLPGSRSTYSISTTVVDKDNVAEFKKQLESRMAP